MQNSESPDSSREAFHKKASVSNADRIALDIIRLNNPRVQRGFDKLRERQQGARDVLGQRLEKERPENIRLVAEDLMQQRLHPALRPRHLRKQTRKELESECRRQAKVIVAKGEREQFAKLDTKLLLDQERYLQSARSTQHRLNFNAKSKEGTSIKFDGPVPPSGPTQPSEGRSR